MTLQYKSTGAVKCTGPIDVDNLRGKTVLITGGSSGLGYAYLNAFVRAGAVVVNADLKPPPDDASLLNVYHSKCDVRSWSDQKAAFDLAASKSANGLIDVIVANAGISGDDPFLFDVEAPDVQEPDMRIVQVNLIGAMFTIRLALNHFLRRPEIDPREKCLILKSSLAGYLDSRPSYGSAKAGLRAVMRSLRHRGTCRINIVAPWFIHTPIMADDVAKVLTGQLEALGSDWARIDDCVHCVLRISTDSSIHGRGFGIVPRRMVAEGYCDLEQDDFPSGTLCNELQRIILGVSHRK